jgi:HlyD family secretion protein
VEVEVAPVTQGRFEISIEEDGKTRLADRFLVSAPLAGRVSRITLREGDPVGADGVVATLTPVLPAMLDERTLRELQARVEGAQANVQRAATRVERAQVGLQNSEASVALGTPLLELGDISRLEIVAELLTPDALAAQPGSRVVIDRWGGPSTLEGRVTRTEPAAFTKVSALGVEEQRVRVLIEITSPPEQWKALGDAFRVGVRIVTLAQPDAVQVPVSAVFPLQEADNDADGGDAADGGAANRSRYGVFVVDRGHARIAPVVLAGRNGSAAWVRSGLAPGASVIVYPPAAVHDGVRVAARKV